MKLNSHTFIVLIGLLGSASVFSQNNLTTKSLGTTKTITIPKDGAQYVFNSPDGKYICYSSQDLNKVYIRNLVNKNTSNQLIFEGTNAGYFPQWMGNSKTIFLRSKNKKESTQRISSWLYSIENNTINEQVLPLPAIVNTSSVLKNKNGDFLYINDKLMLEMYNTETKKTVVFAGTESCYQLVLSPLGDKIAVHIGPNIWVYALNQLTPAINLGTGLVSSWSPNGKYLLGFKEEKNDGHQMGNTDVYAFDVESQKSIQLTFTKKSQEINPSWAFDGKGIYYVDFKTGGILYSKLKSK